MGFGVLKDYGVDKVFELENDNTDTSQRNIVYLVHGEKAGPIQAVAGKSVLQALTRDAVALRLDPAVRQAIEHLRHSTHAC